MNSYSKAGHKTSRNLSKPRKADAHFASKNTLIKRNTLLLKSLTHFAAKNTWQDTLYSTAHLAP